MILLGDDFSWTFTDWASELSKLSDQQDNLLDPDDWTGLFSSPESCYFQYVFFFFNSFARINMASEFL